VVERIVQHDQSAEAVAHQKERELTLLRADGFHEAPEILPEFLPAFHVGPLPGRPPVTPEVVRMDGDPARHTVVDQRGIQPRVVAQAVDIQQDGLRASGGSPGLAEQ
jgi:hypothetical protein